MLGSLSLPTILIIVWAAVIALALLIEVLTYDLVTIFFIPSGLVSLILAATIPSDLWWVQLVVFVVMSIVMIFTLRPLLKRWLIKPTIATEVIETVVGEKVRLLIDAVDGKSLIKINGVEWTAQIEGGLNLEKDDVVEIIKNDSNIFLVKPITAEEKKSNASSSKESEEGEADEAYEMYKKTPDEIYKRPARKKGGSK